MVDLYKLKFTILQQEILRFLFIKSGISFNARTLAEQLHVSPTAISKSLPSLEKEEFIRIKKESGRFSIELNRDNPYIIYLKRADNLKQIYESGIFNFLYNEFPGCTIILFGSYSRGEDIFTPEHKSDIDFAIIGTEGKEFDSSKFEKILERKISINFYKSWNDIHKHLKNNLLNGIILSGGIDL